MELYIEKAFLDHFFLSYNESSASRSDKILFSIIKEYGEITWYIDVPITSPEDFENLKLENPFFGFCTNHFPPIPIMEFKDQVLKSNCRQIILLSEYEKDWFKEADHKGALCMTLENYQSKIEKYVDQCHFRLDLDVKFSDWKELSFHNSLPYTEIIISDSYILSDKFNQKMEKNLIPLLDVLLKNAVNKKSIKVNIITKDFNPSIKDNDEKIKEVAKKRYKLLQRLFREKNVSFQIFRYDNENLPTNYDLHDRIIYSNYLFIECGKGFNLIPHKKTSTSRILSESIFDKYSYKTLKKRLKIYEEYINQLREFPSNKFTAYPTLMK